MSQSFDFPVKDHAFSSEDLSEQLAISKKARAHNSHPLNSHIQSFNELFCICPITQLTTYYTIHTHTHTYTHIHIYTSGSGSKEIKNQRVVYI